MAKISVLKMRVAIIIIEDDKILLVKHQKHQRSYWVLPGGTVEWGETLEETAKREIKEETNLEIALGEPAFINDAIPQDGQRHIIDFYFTAKVSGGDLKVTPEKVLREAKFFTIKELDNLVFYPNIKEELKEGWKKSFPDKLKYLGNRWKE